MPPPKPKATKAKESTTLAVTVTVDNREYVVRPDDLTANDTALLRRATGMSFRAVLAALDTDPDIDLIAALVWLARRQNGEPITFEHAATELNYASDYAFGESEVGPGEVPAVDTDG